MSRLGELQTAIIVAPPCGGAIYHAENLTEQQQLMKLWLSGLSRHTQRAYTSDANRFFAIVQKPMREVTLPDVQAFADHLQTLDLVDGTRHRILSAVKSMAAFAMRVGYLQFDVASVLRMPSGKDTLSERILDEDEVRRLIGSTTTLRDRLMLQLIYVAGVRVSELVALKWSDTLAHRGAGQITVLGKGKKTRTIRLEAPMWNALQASRGDAGNDVPIFVSRRGGHLDQSQVYRIVKDAAVRAGINKPVSTHWLRHCHASHALDHGAPIHLVQQTLGHSSVATTSKYLHARPNESSSRFLPPIN
jgi:integrase/recombinase XerD